MKHFQSGYLSDVYFANFHASKPSDSIPKKINKLFKAAERGETFSKGDLVAVKTHFGEEGNSAFLIAELVSVVVDNSRRKGATFPHRLQHAVQGNEI